MSIHYECLECRNIGDLKIIGLYYPSNISWARLLCLRCKSFNLIQINELTGERLHVNGDIDSLHKPGNISAMPKEQKNKRIFFFRLNQIATELVEITAHLTQAIEHMEEVKTLEKILHKNIKQKLEEYEESIYKMLSEISSIRNIVDK